MLIANGSYAQSNPVVRWERLEGLLSYSHQEIV